MALDGRLVDHFWKIDLPFLALFWVEFMARWGLAVRRRSYARWYFFPIFYWYDLLSLVPVTALRPLRLLRLVSIYMRLRQSDLSRVGKDVVSRGVAYISNIITEEVSDRVAVRILSEFAEEIEDGTHVRIARAAIEPRRAEIERVLVSQIRAILTAGETVESALAELRATFQTVAAANIFVFNLPPISGLGNGSGFEYQLQSLAGAAPEDSAKEK